MSTDNAWTDEIKLALEDRAYSLNYNEGVQCRFRFLPTEDPNRTIEIFLETTHSGHPFDLTWLIRYTDNPAAGIDFELIAPPQEGGMLWKAHHDTVLAMRHDAHAIPVFIRGFFVGRAVAVRATDGTKTSA